MPAQPRSHVDAAPLYPVVYERSPPAGSLARDITILRRGLDGHLQRQRRALLRRRLWIASGGLGLGLILSAVASLLF